MEVSLKEEKITLKSLQKHLIKTIFGALGLALIGAFLTSYSFYFNANHNLDDLNKSKDETKQDIKELKKDVSEIKTTLSNTTIYTTENKEKAKSLENDISDMRKQQDEMIKILYEIKAKVK